MLKLTKETLTELTSDDLSSVVGGLSCIAASCITNPIQVNTTFTQTFIHLTMSTDVC